VAAPAANKVVPQNIHSVLVPKISLGTGIFLLAFDGYSPDERKTPFVGAMKIARHVPVSGRYVEWHPPSVGAATSRPQPEGFSMLG